MRHCYPISKIRAWLTAFLLCIASLHCRAEVYNGISYSLDADAKTAIATGLEDYTLTELTFPATVTFDGIDYKVTEIKEWCFGWNDAITKVTISGDVSVGDGSFYGYTNLQNVSINASSIGNLAFCGCSSLESITINASSIGEWAFNGCSNLSTVNLAKTVTSIGNGAFTQTALASFNVDNDNESFCTIDGVLYNKGKTVLVIYPAQKTGDNFTVPEGVQQINYMAFQNCTYPKNITLPESLTFIGTQAFFSCPNLTSINIPKNVTDIYNYAFSGCQKMTSINVDSDNEYFTSDGGVLYSKDKTTLVSWPNAIITGEVVVSDDVKTILPGAFFDCDNLTSVTLPNNPDLYVCNELFNNCDNLQTITCLKEFPAWGDDNAFAHVANFATLIVADGLKEYYKSQSPWNKFKLIKTVGEKTYNNLYFALDDDAKTASVTGLTDASLTEVEIPASVTFNGTTYNVTSISNYAFKDCSDLTSIAIPQSVTSFDAFAFYGCFNLTNISFPENLTDIGDSAFEGCSNLGSITLHKTVSSIGEKTFRSCVNLTINVDEENENYCSIDGVLYNEEKTILFFCKRGTASAIVFPTTLTEIGEYAFEGDGSISNLTIPDGVKTIGTGAFKDCNSLQSVVIPGSVENIYDDAFTNCNSLSSITYLNAEPCFLGWSAFSPCYEYATLIVPDGAKPAFKNHWSWGQFNNITSPNEKTYNELLFFLNSENLTASVTGVENSELETIEIPATVTFDDITYNVTSIAGSAFKDCSNLSTITIPEGVASIDAYAFQNCTKLPNVTLPESVASIGDYAFIGCNDLQSLTIPKNVSSIGTSAFRYCEKLTDINVSADNNDFCSVNGILYSKDKTSLIRCPEGKSNSVSIPEGVALTGDEAFIGCSNLTSITLPSSVSAIGQSVFSESSSLTTIDVNKANNNFCSVDGILYSKDKATLISCPAGKTDNISIPEGVVSISSGAFKQGKLSSVTIPKTVTSIGEGAFDGCENLTTMTCLNTTPPSVGDWTFFWVLDNGTLYVPDNSVDTYRDSSGWNGFSNIREISTSAINDIMVNTDSQTNGSHTMTVYDLAGRKLPNGSLSQLPKGIYIVKTGSKTTKVVIK